MYNGYKWFKAVTILSMIFLNWAALFVWFFGLHVLAVIFMLTTSINSSYWLFLAEDCTINTIMGGHFKTTISSEIGNMHKKGSETGRRVASVVNWIFYKITREERQKNHCIIAMEKEDIYVFDPIRAILGTIVFQCTNYFVLSAVWEMYIS